MRQNSKNIDYLPGVPEKMFLTEIGALLTKERFFWDTLYLNLIYHTVKVVPY